MSILHRFGLVKLLTCGIWSLWLARIVKSTKNFGHQHLHSKPIGLQFQMTFTYISLISRTYSKTWDQPEMLPSHVQWLSPMNDRRWLKPQCGWPGGRCHAQSSWPNLFCLFVVLKNQIWEKEPLQMGPGTMSPLMSQVISQTPRRTQAYELFFN